VVVDPTSDSDVEDRGLSRPWRQADRVEESVKVKKVVMDQSHAEREVDRLNALDRERDSESHWEISQLDMTGATSREGEGGPP